MNESFSILCKKKPVTKPIPLDHNTNAKCDKMSKRKCRKNLNKLKTFLVQRILYQSILIWCFSGFCLNCVNGQELVLNEIDIGDRSQSKVNGYTNLDGGRVVGDRTLRLGESPYLLKTDLEIERSGRLIVEPGVTVHVAPMIGITVRGAINALGTPEQKITFTIQPNSGYSEESVWEPHTLGARLVDGPSPLAGRLQLYHDGKWRSVCTNSRNWTIPDYETTCRQMGFKGGRFWNWVERISDFNPRLLYEEPNCQGNEGSLVQCQWGTRQIGSGVCDYHNDIGMQCLPLHDSPTAHWRGIRFEWAPSEPRLAADNTVYEQFSTSELRHVDIVRAGSGQNGATNAAVEVLGIPPVFNTVTVDQSAYTGINVTRPDSAFTFKEVTVRRSRGIGIFVNSSHGLAFFDRCTVKENGDDGIRYVGHDLRSDERTDRSSLHDFCTLPTTSGQTYPISVSLQQSQFSSVSKECGKFFFTKPGYLVTVNFVHFVMQKNETGDITVFDGSSLNDRVLAAWSIRNFTRPQSVSSTREKIYVRFRAEARSKILGYLRITTGPYKAYDLNVTKSIIANNGGRGVAIDNLRSKIHVHSSAVSNNGHAAGVHVTSGAGDVNITDSLINYNHGDGVNITYYGGNRNISRSSIVSNSGYGISVWLNHTKEKDRLEYLAFNQTTVVEYSDVIKNLEAGILHGNFCGDYWVNVTGNKFNDSASNSVDIQTCWFNTHIGQKLHLQIGHNIFEHDNKIGIIINPAVNMFGKIEYNHFRYGKYGSLFIRNKAWDEFRILPAHLVVQHNQFYNNRGVFVASIGLSPYSERENQSLIFTRNFVRMNNIQEPFGPIDEEGEGKMGENRLSPRSRVAAPVVISSGNVDVFRNIIQNKESKYEVGSQVADQSMVLNVTYNWLGHSDEEKIFNRLFHRKDRYDLARIEYIPYLLHNSNPGTNTIMAFATFVPRFFTEGLDRIGGEVDGQEILPTGTYTVDRDINVRPGGKLILQPGVVLNFSPGVGMMVAGKLEARGRNPDDIFFTLKRAPIMTYENDTTDDIMNAENLDMETEAVPDVIVEEEPKIPIRLLGGATEHEGRLQVYLNKTWGTVCDYGWSIIDAALVCHQLGLALNPLDWRMQRSEVPSAGTTEDVLLSHVRCTEQDTDVTKCRAERASKGEFFNSCSHDHDVGLRCYEGAWAGLRFGVLAERADLQYVTVEKAGLFDYATNTFKPAIQMDFARHNLENVRVVNNLHDGLGIIYSDIYGGSINNVKNSEFSNNQGSGISLKQLGLRVHGSMIRDNLGAGISHNPVLSAIEQRELAGWFSMAPDFNIHDSDYRPFVLPRDTSNIDVDIWQNRHILTSKVIGEHIERTIHIRCQPGYVIGMQLLNPIQNGSTEEIYILDSQTPNRKSDVYQLSRDLSVFPATSSSYGVILEYKSGVNALGGVVLVISTTPAPVQDIRNRIVRGPVPTLHVTSTKIQRNARGVTATFYNRYLGERGEHYLRKANESIKISQTEISHNNYEAILMHAPFWDIHVSNLSEVTIHLNNSLVASNGRGIRHFSKDLRSSNNLFHYVIQDTTVEGNRQGGLEISLPFVWQYNENFTHSVYLGNDTWARNKDFGVHIAGHYAVVNVTANIFKDNECLEGLIGFQGMEKKLKIDYNKFVRNNGRYVIEFSADSLSEILGEVHAIFSYNEIRHNKFVDYGLRKASYTASRPKNEHVKDPTRVIGFKGVQKVKIYRNLITDNELKYDLVAGIKSARLNNFLDATENWWGSAEPQHILERIFDFDDWNNHAEVLFRPFLIENSIDGSLSVSFEEMRRVDLDNLGGRIFNNLDLYRRGIPYVVNKDITVMPGATLTIHAATEFEFAPNVGILVLGKLIARGYADGEVVMRVQRPKASDLRHIETRAVESLVLHDSIRLCTEGKCSNDDNEIDPKRQGFLEYFNHTTLQWVPICDRRFTERNAQVVCRELGFDPLDTYFGHDYRIEYHTNSLTRIWSWVQPLECQGDESNFADCPERLNGQLYGHRHECKWRDQFVFVSCNGDATPREFWGGIRFAHSDFERNNYEYRIHDIHTHETVRSDESHLEFVRIEGAGMLHNEKSPAVQTIFKTPTISSVTIKNSAHHGINLISPSNTMHMQFLKIQNTLGEGINAISLSGEGRESDESSFTPLKSLDLPYHLFSMIDICDTSKEIIIEERVIVYYKYDNNPVNCVKIFNSAYRVKPLGFRLLQSNLFNHSKEYGRRDAIHLIDGDIYNITAQHIGSIEADSANEKNLFRTKSPILSVRLSASGAPAHHGFIAEIVTLPISAIVFNRDAQHNVSYSEITGAVRGAISYSTAGEVSPILTIENNRIMRNCRQLYGNFSTCEAAVRIDVQNMQTLQFRNNLVKSNQGGLFVRSDSRGSATSLRAWIHHNLFVTNRNRPSLYAEGRQSSPYQEVTIYRNYFSQNAAAYANVIVLLQVVSNFTQNYVHSNRGGRIAEISGFDKVRLPIYQTTSHNGFYDNVATDWRGRATIVAGTAGQHYVDNIFYNPDNDYEMITVNRSITIDLWKTKIDAAHNYWNYNETLAVGGRIRDRFDDQNLLEVQYTPYHMNNRTILDEKCPPGWALFVDTCYTYVAAPMTFYEARDFCRSDNATMPFIRGPTDSLWRFLQRQQSHLRYPEKVWVQDYSYLEKCTAFIYQRTETDDCDTKRGFLCEIDPKVEIVLTLPTDIVAISVISAFFLAFILLTLFGFCWFSKSRHRHVQRLERRNSIRQSLRSLNTIDPQGSIRRRNYSISRSTDTLTKSTITTPDYKKMMSNGSIDSMDKSVLSSEASYDIYEVQQQQQHQDKVGHNGNGAPTNGYNDILTPKFNEYLNLRNSSKKKSVTPPESKANGLPEYESERDSQGFELSFRNEGFRDNSTFTTRNNSIGTNINEDTPIIHQTDVEDTGSDYYGNSSTLPIRAKGESLSFLTELKNRLPEYERMPPPQSSSGHTSFLPSPPDPPYDPPPSSSSISSSSFGKKIDNMKFSPKSTPSPPVIHEYQKPEIRRPAPALSSKSNSPPAKDVRRPDSYYTAMRSARDSRMPPQVQPPQPPIPVPRPRPVYEASGDDRPAYSRSKSEVLLETNFDSQKNSKNSNNDSNNSLPPTIPLSSDSRSYSQPLETAM